MRLSSSSNYQLVKILQKAYFASSFLYFKDKVRIFVNLLKLKRLALSPLLVFFGGTFTLFVPNEGVLFYALIFYL